MIAIIIYGPPGAGKGTQAQLLADKLNLFHFDTGKYIRELLYRPSAKKNKLIERERKFNESGQLNTSSWVFKIVKDKINEVSKLKKNIILSGSPRTMFEAFGDKNHNGVFGKGLLRILEDNYGKKNIYIFKINISENETIRRNSHRLVCSVCGASILFKLLNLKNFKFSRCLFCGGKLKHRFDDSKKIILTRLKEYSEKTAPIVAKLKERKYKVFEINGNSMPYKIHKSIISRIKL